ncbi:hypothetical protein [Streptomyces sp. NPDC058086]
MTACAFFSHPGCTGSPRHGALPAKRADCTETGIRVLTWADGDIG